MDLRFSNSLIFHPSFPIFMSPCVHFTEAFCSAYGTASRQNFEHRSAKRVVQIANFGCLLLEVHLGVFTRATAKGQRPHSAQETGENRFHPTLLCSGYIPSAGLPQLQRFLAFDLSTSFLTSRSRLDTEGRRVTQVVEKQTDRYNSQNPSSSFP